MEYLNIGEILKAQGIKGEVKIRPFCDDINLFLKLKTVRINGTDFAVGSVRVDRFAYVKLLGVDTRNDAERLVGAAVEIDKAIVPPLPQFSFYISELMGCKVFLGDSYLGVLVDVGQYGAADVHTVELENGNKVRYPFLKKLIVEINTAEKRIVLDRRQFEQVCVYED